MAYLDENGLEHFWGKIKDHVSSAIAPKANDADVLHKTGTETVSGEKVFSGSQTTAAGNASALLVVKDPNLIKGETPATNHFLSLGFIDSTGDSYAQDVSSRLAVMEYKSPSEADPEGYMQMVDMGFNGGGSVRLRVGHNEDNIPYATAPATSDDRTESTDIVTRGYMEASEWNWQKTKMNALVQFKPVPESDLEPVVDFMFTETPPAEGEKGPENPSTIAGVTQVKVTRCGKNLLPELTEAGAQYGVTYTPLADGGYRIYGETDGSHHSYVTILNSLTLGIGVQYTVSFTSETVTNGVSIIGKDSNNSTVFSANLNSPVTLTGDGKPLLIRFMTNRTAGAVDLVAYPQIELGATATAFEPYEGNDYTIQLGDTYYGGSLNVATGVMTVTHNYISNVAGGTTSFGIEGDYAKCLIQTSEAVKNDNLSLVCNRFATGESSGERVYCRDSDIYWSVNCIILKSRLDFSFAADPSNPTDAEVAEAFSSWLVSNPTSIVFARTVPVTVQLAPTQIKSLVAVDKYVPRPNMVYSDQQAVQVGYQRFYDENRLAALEARVAALEGS